ncbi:MAG: NAD(P)/FAD-dependent oxidoreductase [Candidatus Promineifilaceae bacterium]
MKIAIVGAGVAGLAAAYDLLAAGHEVTLYEASDHAGGLAAGFRDEAWEWPLEKFYHHLFTSDKAILGLAAELGMAEQVFFRRPTTSVLYQGQIVPFDSPVAWATFPGFNPADVLRFGLVSAYLRFTSPWRQLERHTADAWLRRWYGDKIYEMVWRPLLIGKFGPYFQQANMAWMWARLHVRSPRLGYFVGGFQAFIDRLVAAVQARGGRLELNAPVLEIAPQADGGLCLALDGRQALAQRCLVTTSPALLGRMAPTLPADYAGQLAELKSLGAVVLILALKRQLMAQTYWLNLPAEGPDKSQNEIPFLALVEHTNYIDRERYGGDHLVYCGDYVAPDHRYFELSQEELLARFSAALPRFNAAFRPGWIRQSWLFRTRYAQPVPEVNHSRHIPPIPTPMPYLYFASMSQVYPWDRGTNYAVEIGRRAAGIILNSERAQG